MLIVSLGIKRADLILLKIAGGGLVRENTNSGDLASFTQCTVIGKNFLALIVLLQISAGQHWCLVGDEEPQFNSECYHVVECFQELVF